MHSPIHVDTLNCRHRRQTPSTRCAEVATEANAKHPHSRHSRSARIYHELPKILLLCGAQQRTPGYVIEELWRWGLLLACQALGNPSRSTSKYFAQALAPCRGSKPPPFFQASAGAAALWAAGRLPGALLRLLARAPPSEGLRPFLTATPEGPLCCCYYYYYYYYYYCCCCCCC
jgi:hypothetical protein